MASSLVIKVKYGGTLRRFNAPVAENGQLDLDKDALRAKIVDLFGFPLDADFTLTYIDEDGDVVTLVDDDDLRDVMKQQLKFLRLNVQLNDDKFGRYSVRSSGSSTPMRSPQVNDPLPSIGAGLADVFKSLPEPLHDVLSKLSLDVASKAMSTKAVSSSPLLTELVDCLSKMGQSSPLAPQSQDGGHQSTRNEASKVAPSLAVPDASKDGAKQDNGQASLNSSSQPGQEASAKNLTGGVRGPTTPVIDPVPAPVDINLDSKKSGSPDVRHVPVTSDGKETKKQGEGPHSKKASVTREVFGSFPLGFGAYAGASAGFGSGFGASAGFGSSSGFGTSLSTGFGEPCSYRGVPSGGVCPFSGLPLTNISAPAPSVRPSGSKKVQGSGDVISSGIFHKGVQCDGCGVHPITGPRYKSKVKDDYDLCSICFAEMGNEADYIKMDRPMSSRRFFKYNPSSNWYAPPSSIGSGMNPSRPKLDSRFILDVNVPDGTLIAPSTPFTKIWRMRNSGSLVWPPGAKLVCIGGDRFSYADASKVEIPPNGVPVDGELDIRVDFVAPKLPGRYISYWRMASPSGIKFGQRVWVLIQVDASLKDSSSDTSGGLNLNLPPGSSKVPEILDVNAEPVVELSVPTSDSVPEKPIVVEEAINQELYATPMYGTLDSLAYPYYQPVSMGYPPTAHYYQPAIVEGGNPPGPSQPVAAAVVGPTQPVAAPVAAATVEPTQPVAAADAPNSSEIAGENDPVEKALLKELEDMGFKQVDLNKEILRMNEYNLEQSVDALCGVAEWDPILEELEEMGFNDKEMNRKLLKKNNGSIKRVVMDILSGEKA
ncbi:hypothetical protein Tsubulata_007129 [Turnera subulata]|uniref:ZZ-type domain-containing protein n=1 Tax=Turnera subulata TaxID=218843 RepID=A0A9Q0GLT5_9ROSI|nr:hypothetical protein Tsubulata_007129 [Turnera subulata]